MYWKLRRRSQLYFINDNNFTFKEDYTKEHELEKSKNKFNMAATPAYDQLKNINESTNDVNICYFLSTFKLSQFWKTG